MKLVTKSQEYMDPAMNENSGNHKTSVDGGNTVSSEVKNIQVKKGIWRTYDGTDGLPPTVRCLLQDRRGYLWLGTMKGLCRYDRARFITYTTEDGLPANDVRAICEDSQGRLWLGTKGGGVSCYDGERFITYTTEDGLVPNEEVISICEDSQGHLWFGTTRGGVPWRGGVSCYNGEGFTNYTIKDGLIANNVSSIYEDSQGRLWFGTNGGVSCFGGEQFINYTTGDGLSGNNVRAICEDRQGRLWFGTDGGVSCYDGEDFSNYTTKDDLIINHVTSVYEDSQGHLWFGTWGNGVCRFDGSSFTIYTTADGLLDNHSVDMLQDREGSFWFVHSHSGLTRFDAETTRLLTGAAVPETLIQTREGALWYGAADQLCYLYKGEQRCQTFDSRVCALMEDSSGRFWVAIMGDGLYCYNSTDAVWEGKPRHFTTEDGLNRDTIWSVIETRNGTIWVGTYGSPGCLCRFDGSRFETIQTPHRVVQRLLEDSYGRIWMGGWDGGGLSYYTPDEDHAASLHNYTMEHGLPSDDVISIMEDDAGRLWIGTSDGLCCFDGNQFVSYGEEIPDHGVHHQCSARDANGQLWFGTLGNGIYRYDGRHFQQLSKADVLPSNSVTGFFPQLDGSMIISTYGGIVHYRPTATEPPKIEIREVVADKIYPHPSAIELTTTGAGLVTIFYHGLSLSTHRMRYSYILEGYHKEWQDTWESQVRYEKLPLGEYTFRVIAINRDLVCSEVPAAFQLTVVPDPRDEQIAHMQSELDHLRRAVQGKYDFENIIGNSIKMREVRALMEIAIDSGFTVLITGETGTGKELVANAIHYSSPRKGHPLLDRNCGAIPKELLASDLFGHHKGAFTGAQEDKMGLFEAASGGTVLLDEISEMSLDAQIHLLRVLEEWKVRRLGENISRDVDVRIIAMTNKDLIEEGKAGRFREDLYFRLSEFPIHIPPLRERTEDIPLLAEHFLQEYSQEQKKELNGFESGVFEMLQSYSWPGNVRELRNEIHRACALAESGKCIQTYHFSTRVTGGESLIQEIVSEQLSYRESLNSFSKRLVEDALGKCNGNRTQAAKLLGMKRPNLVALIKRLSIKEPDI